MATTRALLLAAMLSCSRAPRRADAGEAVLPLQVRIERALRAMGPDYVPRTRHRRPDGAPRYTNRLILEASPYLRQHAHNPVDWYPWGPEALERARRLNRPIFLSVGYSTCHWCHVMEEESFEDEEIAAYLNEHYVPIKVDREERPDVDATYMSMLQAMTGQGGWPMSLWLTPAREPFFAGTYFPPRAGVRGARRAFLDLLRAQRDRFAASPSGVAVEARSLAERVRVRTAPEPVGDFPSAGVIRGARVLALQVFDPVAGGRAGAPKFPASYPLRLLLRTSRREGDVAERERVATTLRQMRTGGLWDHLAGGFHRYAVDARWRVPHFEKMLYDNARLAVDYLEGAQATGDAAHADTARQTLDYLLREMRSPQGTFYAATDADSLTPQGRREEGAFFTWTRGELTAALGEADGRVAAGWFDLDGDARVDGRSVLHTPRGVNEVAAALGLPADDVRAAITRVTPTLRAVRARRAVPLRDDKVIVAWNALTVTALARAARVLAEPRYADAAIRAANALLAPRRGGRALPHTLREGVPQGEAFADDVVFLAAAAVDLFELTSDPRWLDEAISLSDEADRRFADPQRGDYFLSSATHESMLLRERSDYDGPVPSASAVAALTSLRLHGFTGAARFQQRAEMTLRAFTARMTAQPLGVSEALLALDWATDAPREVVVVIPDGAGALHAQARGMLDALRGIFAPNTLLVVATESALSGEIGARVPCARGKRLRAGQPTAYVCERGTCLLPTSSPPELAAQLTQTRPYP